MCIGPLLAIILNIIIPTPSEPEAEVEAEAVKDAVAEEGPKSGDDAARVDI